VSHVTAPVREKGVRGSQSQSVYQSASNGVSRSQTTRNSSCERKGGERQPTKQGQERGRRGLVSSPVSLCQSMSVDPTTPVSTRPCVASLPCFSSHPRKAHPLHISRPPPGDSSCERKGEGAVSQSVYQSCSQSISNDTTCNSTQHPRTAHLVLSALPTHMPRTPHPATHSYSHPPPKTNNVCASNAPPTPGITHLA
jgi:hypothetical protein